MKDIKGKNIAVLGAFRSGLGAAKLALRKGAVPFVSDSGPYEKLEDGFRFLQSLGIDYEFGKHSQRVYDADIIVTSPGIPTESDVLMKASFLGKKIVSELEFASWFCKGDILAITGTNGKTTTTSLAEHLFKNCGMRIKSAGNIGLAFSEIVRQVKTNDLVALETSSFQLDFTDEFKPRFAVILNITPDHLDRYHNNFGEYADSKLKIAKNQNEEDYLITNADDPNIPDDIGNEKVQRYYFSTREKVSRGSFYADGKFFFIDKGIIETVATINDFNLVGEHNISNALSVITIAKILECHDDMIRDALYTFQAVEHRLEIVRTLAGVKYVNDSKATNVESVWYALQSFDEQIMLILGGKDKGNDYNRILELVRRNVRKIYAIGSSAQKVYDFFRPYLQVEIMGSMEDAVNKCRQEAAFGEVVLLSPACASFDMFNNYEHRGQVFKELVNELG